MTHLRLHGVAEEEGHHAGVDLVLEHPGGPARGVHPQEGEGVEGGEHAEDHEELTNADNLCGLQSEHGTQM